MKWLVFIIGILICLIFFGPGILGCFALMLAILGFPVDVAFSLAKVLTVLFVTAIGFKAFFYDK
jgi:hypothetical protein